MFGYHAQRDPPRYVHRAIAHTGILPAGKDPTQVLRFNNAYIKAKSVSELPHVNIITLPSHPTDFNFLRASGALYKYLGVKNVVTTIEMKYRGIYPTRCHAKQPQLREGVKGSSGRALKR